MNTLFKFFDNNGHLRGALYFSLAALPIIGTGLEHWSKTPPANWYEVATVITSAFIAGLVSLRAYIDQHLTRNPAKPSVEEPAKPTANKPLTTSL